MVHLWVDGTVSVGGWIEGRKEGWMDRRKEGCIYPTILLMLLSCKVPRTIEVSHMMQAASSMCIHNISTSDKGSMGGNGLVFGRWRSVMLRMGALKVSVFVCLVKGQVQDKSSLGLVESQGKIWSGCDQG